MTEKNAKIFRRILIVTAIVWILGVLLPDIAAPIWADRLRDPSEPVVGGHGGGWLLLGTPLCIAVVIVSCIVLRIRSRNG